MKIPVLYHLSCIIISLLLFGPAAKSQGKGRITGTIGDSLTKKPIPYATVSVFRSADTSLLNYTLSNTRGSFSVNALPVKTPIYVVITSSGHQDWRRQVVLADDGVFPDFGVITLGPRIREMEGVTVTAETPPVVVKNDTIEFNAASFKTLPNSLVEDLLKKLPGISITPEGVITVNGRKVNRIQVDGKNFFGGDTKMATRNLPANLIEKIQVMPDSDDLIRNPDITPGEAGQIVNLSLKKSIDKKIFGRVFAGGGVHDKYEAGGVLNYFRDTLQITGIANINNLSSPGFTVSNVRNTSPPEGIMRSDFGAVNINSKIPGKGLANIFYRYGSTHSSIDRTVNTQQYFADTTLGSEESSRTHDTRYDHVLGADLKWPLGRKSFLQYRPSLSFSDQNKNTYSSISNTSNKEGLISSGESNLSNNGHTNATTQFLTFYHPFLRKSQLLTISAALKTTTDRQPVYTLTNNHYYQTNEEQRTDQLRQEDQKDYSGILDINYTHPVSAQTLLRVWQTLDWSRSTDGVNTYEMNPLSGDYDLINDAFTNTLRRTGWRSHTKVSFRVKQKNVTVVPGISFRSISLRNSLLKGSDIKQHFNFLSPNLIITWKSLNLSYDMIPIEPEANDLQPVVNNNNPLIVREGNPDLKPSLSHTLTFQGSGYNPGRNSNYNFSIGASVLKDAIIRERTVDLNGAQTSAPVNINHIFSLSGKLGVGKQYKILPDWKFSFDLSALSRYENVPVILNKLRSNSRNLTLSPKLMMSVNWKQYIELTQQYEAAWTSMSYSSPLYQNINIWRHYLSSAIIVRPAGGVSFDNSLVYIYNPQIAAGIQRNSWSWNTAVSIQFLKYRKGVLRLLVHDLLNNNASVQRIVRENYVRSSETIVLKRYFLATFSYTIQKTGDRLTNKQKFLMF